MKDFLHSLLSRKFLAAVGAAALAASQHQYDVAVGVVAAWILAEAHVDAKAATATATADADKAVTAVRAVADATVVAAGDPRFT